MHVAARVVVWQTVVGCGGVLRKSYSAFYLKCNTSRPVPSRAHVSCRGSASTTDDDVKNILHYHSNLPL